MTDSLLLKIEILNFTTCLLWVCCLSNIYKKFPKKIQYIMKNYNNFFRLFAIFIFLYTVKILSLSFNVHEISFFIMALSINSIFISLIFGLYELLKSKFPI